jgi:chemotaxis protein MotB
MINENDMNPNRMILQGYGDSRPIASNDTPDGRSKNRRVELTIILEDPQGGIKPGNDSGSSSNTNSPATAPNGSNTGPAADTPAETDRTGTGFIRQSRP